MLDRSTYYHYHIYVQTARSAEMNLSSLALAAGVLFLSLSDQFVSAVAYPIEVPIPPKKMASTFLFTSESVNEGHPGELLSPEVRL
jgi:hypothetical protein